MKRSAAVLTAAAGTLFCLLSALGFTAELCHSDGCRLFEGATLLGLDLYWYGTLFFAIATWLIARAIGRRSSAGRTPLGRSLVLWMLGGLLVSSTLLAIQALTVPCVSCLIVAALLGLTVLLLLPGSRILTVALACWALIMVGALSGLARQHFQPLPIYGERGATIKLFFSPSCPSCVKELRELAHREELHSMLALFPLAMNKGDSTALFRFNQELKLSGTLAEAVEAMQSRATENPVTSPTFKELQQIRLQSFRNKAFLAAIGARTVPYLQTSNPGLLIPPASSDENAQSAEAALAPPEEGCEYNQQEAECKEEGVVPLLQLEQLMSPR